MTAEPDPAPRSCPGTCGTHGPLDRPVVAVPAEEGTGRAGSDPVLAFADGAALAAAGGRLVRLAALRGTPAGHVTRRPGADRTLSPRAPTVDGAPDV